MSRIQIEGARKHAQALRIDGLEDQHAAGAELPLAHLRESEDLMWATVLDELRTENAAERAVRDFFQMRESVRLDDLEALLPAEQRHVPVEVYAPGLDACLGQELEEFASAAADVQDRLLALEVLQISALAILDLGLGASESILEARVVELAFRKGPAALAVFPASASGILYWHAAQGGDPTGKPVQPENCSVQFRTKRADLASELLLTRDRAIQPALERVGGGDASIEFPAKHGCRGPLLER